jgi:uncharacterized protein (TIGR00730 family)
MKNICVFCGSSNGLGDSYMESARKLGAVIVAGGFGLVYGGASVGTMGAIADSVLQAGGQVTGVIPQSIADMEVAHTGLTSLEVVADMHQRKARMMLLSDGFIAMPGGLGTLEEIFEALTWLQLGFHSKPCAVLNSNGYYDKLLAFLDHASHQGFAKQGHVEQLMRAETPEEVIKMLVDHKISFEPKLG